MERMELLKNQIQKEECSNDSIEQEYSLKELSQYDGVKNPQVLISLMNVVIDVSNAEFYKPGGPYHIFAGKDCSVALAKMKLEEQFMNCYGTVELTAEEKKILQDWFDKLSKKYKVVGKLI